MTMDENALRQLIQQIQDMRANAPVGGVGNVSNREMEMFQQGQRNSYMDEIMNMRNNASAGGLGNVSQAELVRLMNNPSQISSGDPDGMTAPPMQLSPQQIQERIQAYEQQELLKQLNGVQQQRRDDAPFDAILNQILQRRSQ